MDSNKDEAERCLELAERFFQANRFDDAEKFIKKAQRLFPTKRADGNCRKIFILVNPGVSICCN